MHLHIVKGVIDAVEIEKGGEAQTEVDRYSARYYKQGQGIQIMKFKLSYDFEFFSVLNQNVFLIPVFLSGVLMQNIKLF